jgi:AcrR family transcriptional regulator
MARWEPDARGRLENAALELFQERGYANTTVQEIAARAGLTERTFFRYFTDKREVLFSGSENLEKAILDVIERASQAATPLEIVGAAFEAAGSFIQERRSFSYARARNTLITTNAELQERELIKLASLGQAVTKALRARGVAEPAASLTAELGVAIFKVGFQRWVSGKKPRDLPAHIRAALDAVRLLVGARSEG